MSKNTDLFERALFLKKECEAFLLESLKNNSDDSEFIEASRFYILASGIMGQVVLLENASLNALAFSERQRRVRVLSKWLTKYQIKQMLEWGELCDQISKLARIEISEEDSAYMQQAMRGENVQK